ncbi:MAG: 4Fe-4S dicluster domain-containing protein [Ruminiclostridium sp.]|nr:4Fe-4S dicluster domain-containing protein [Ruminiclostridium sp.]
MAHVDYKELKKGGFMRQVQKDRFSLRLRIVGGQIQADQLLKVHEIAKRYGQGYIHMTSRQGIEIPHIKLEDVETVKKELAEAGLQPGVCGPRVRTVTACQGSMICSSGLIDTISLAKEFDQKYYARELPHKFKLGITGCRNNCLKAEENDLGVKGGMKPEWTEDKCNFCGLCAAVCREKSIVVDKQNQKLAFDESTCNYCGRCVKSCPSGAWEGKSGFVVYFGGLFGNRIAIGKQLFPIIFSTEVLHRVIETTLEFFKNHGKQSERFGNTLDRVGWELLQKELEEALKN